MDENRTFSVQRIKVAMWIAAALVPASPLIYFAFVALMHR